MTARVSSPVVIGAATLLLLVGLLVGFRLLTASADTTEAGPSCEPRTVAVGEKLTTSLVTVDVFNASRRAGLANRLSINLQRRGFLAGRIGNSPSKVEVDRVAILTTDRSDPRVRLVARQLGGKIQYVEPDVAVDDQAVTVLAGDDFGSLRKKVTRAIEADREVTVCPPVVTLE